MNGKGVLRIGSKVIGQKMGGEKERKENNAYVESIDSSW